MPKILRHKLYKTFIIGRIETTESDQQLKFRRSISLRAVLDDQNSPVNSCDTPSQELDDSIDSKSDDGILTIRRSPISVSMFRTLGSKSKKWSRRKSLKPPTPPPAENKPKGNQMYPVGYHSLKKSQAKPHSSPEPQRRSNTVDYAQIGGGTLPRSSGKKSTIRRQPLVNMSSVVSVNPSLSRSSHSFRETAFHQPRLVH